MSSINSETETVIKKILPYLSRRGYDAENDIDFETAVSTTDRYSKGFVDLLINGGGNKPMFLIEAKKSSKTLNNKDRDQAISYAKALKLFFVVVTNGRDIKCYNVKNKLPILWNGELAERIPTKDQLKVVLRVLHSNPDATNVPLNNDASLPFRPGLAVKQLNALFARCHNAIRKIEKDEEHTFADFSKLLFLKLLEEKADISNFVLPYSYRFHELARRPETECDQVQDAITRMLKDIKEKTPYGDVLEDKVHLIKPKTYCYIVQQLAAVSFYDSSLDSKGAAFEYFVRATLKGKKLGQYFTPRPLIELMLHLVGREKILNAVSAGTKYKVLDPACGTGGFLVFLMQENLRLAEKRYHSRSMPKATLDEVTEKLKKCVFFGSDANPGVACAAKMNMIIAGDGHSNIQAEDSLSSSAKNWSLSASDCDLIMTNPPFGTSETASLALKERQLYPITSAKGQHLFIQKMALSAKPGGEICTVIDEGFLNTDSAIKLRRWLLQKCRLIAVVCLPEVTFKPNKINVRSSVLYLQRLENDYTDGDSGYKVTFCNVASLGYNGSGDDVRGFVHDRLYREFSDNVLNIDAGTFREGYNWQAFDVDVKTILADDSTRFDWKYWEPNVYKHVQGLAERGAKRINDLNKIPTQRGVSPPSDLYVDEADGYALVVKAGSSISQYGELIPGGDFIEKNLYDEYVESQARSLVQEGDVLLSSTGDGTLGKCCVYRSDSPAVADGHVTIIRVDPTEIVPEYLCDYLRCGFGSKQVERLYTGSTGLIELAASDVNTIVVDLLSGIEEQAHLSSELRDKERQYRELVSSADLDFVDARSKFATATSAEM